MRITLISGAMFGTGHYGFVVEYEDGQTKIYPTQCQISGIDVDKIEEINTKACTESSNIKTKKL